MLACRRQRGYAWRSPAWGRRRAAVAASYEKQTRGRRAARFQIGPGLPQPSTPRTPQTARTWGAACSGHAQPAQRPGESRRPAGTGGRAAWLFFQRFFSSATTPSDVVAVAGSARSRSNCSRPWRAACCPGRLLRPSGWYRSAIQVFHDHFRGVLGRRAARRGWGNGATTQDVVQTTLDVVGVACVVIGILKAVQSQS